MISIIIPVYNCERYLSEALRSALTEQNVELEVIAVDDGSTDSSSQILAQYAASDPRLRVITQPNLGVSAARNAGLDAARGEYIFFLDADDAIVPGALNNLLHGVRRTNADIAIGAISKKELHSGSDLSKFDSFLPALILEMALYQRGDVNDNCMLNSVWGKLFHHSLFEHERFNEDTRYEDLDIAYRLYNRAHTIAVTDAKVYFYRINPQGFMQQFTLQRLDVLNVVDRMVEFTKANIPGLEQAARNRRFSAYYNMYLLAQRHGHPAVAQRCLGVIKEMRREVLMDNESRLKNRLGALLAFAPFLLAPLARILPMR